MERDRHRKARTAGLTLVELIVVLGIVGVLAAIVIPVFVHARENARRTTCVSNMRQIGLAMQAYVQDDNGTFPLNFSWQGAIMPYAKSPQVFRCPSLPNDYPEETDYAFDFSRLNIFSLPFSTHQIRGVQEGAIVLPASVVLVGETGVETADGVLWYTDNNPRESCSGFVGDSTVHSGPAEPTRCLWTGTCSG